MVHLERDRSRQSGGWFVDFSPIVHTASVTGVYFIGCGRDFNRQSAMLLFSPTCPFIHMRQTSNRDFSRISKGS